MGYCNSGGGENIFAAIPPFSVQVSIYDKFVWHMTLSLNFYQAVLIIVWLNQYLQGAHKQNIICNKQCNL